MSNQVFILKASIDSYKQAKTWLIRYPYSIEAAISSAPQLITMVYIEDQKHRSAFALAMCDHIDYIQTVSPLTIEALFQDSQYISISGKIK